MYSPVGPSSRSSNQSSSNQLLGDEDRNSDSLLQVSEQYQKDISSGDIWAGLSRANDIIASI